MEVGAERERYEKLRNIDWWPVKCDVVGQNRRKNDTLQNNKSQDKSTSANGIQIERTAASEEMLCYAFNIGFTGKIGWQNS